MGIRLLHTADWHIGKMLHGADLSADHQLFLKELLDIIRNENISHLLVAGDVFDHANPSNDALGLYYFFLQELCATGCRIIITGGNHDSPGVLNAPRYLLNRLNVTVIGCATEDPTEQLIPLNDETGKTQAVLAAVPYLRDRDVRKSAIGEAYTDRIEALREGIRMYYAQLESLCREKFPDVPAITCGHLYAQGAESSDSEREIQIGNQAAIDETTFGSYFHYVALGHIHRPQQVGKSGRVQYSGSPIALSISERNYSKRVIVVSVDNNTIISSDIPLSTYRELLLLEGSPEKIENSIMEFNPLSPLSPMAEIRVLGTTFDPLVLAEKDRLTQLAGQKGILILQSGVFFSESERLKKEDRLSDRDIEELQPLDVLRSQFTEEDDALKKEIESAFLMLLERLGEKGAAK